MLGKVQHGFTRSRIGERNENIPGQGIFDLSKALHILSPQKITSQADT
jgi:hypothetical protein